jgi:hypothetical protein
MMYLDSLDNLVHLPHALVTDVKQFLSEFKRGAHEKPVEGHSYEEGNISNEGCPSHQTVQKIAGPDEIYRNFVHALLQPWQGQRE